MTSAKNRALRLGSTCHLSKQKRTHNTHINFVAERKFECTHTRQGYGARSDVILRATDPPSKLSRRFDKVQAIFSVYSAPRTSNPRLLIKRKVRSFPHARSAAIRVRAFISIPPQRGRKWTQKNVPLTFGRKRQLRKMHQCVCFLCVGNKKQNNSLWCGDVPLDTPTCMAIILTEYYMGAEKRLLWAKRVACFYYLVLSSFSIERRNHYVEMCAQAGKKTQFFKYACFYSNSDNEYDLHKKPLIC